jgi:hypothetical protein
VALEKNERKEFKVTLQMELKKRIISVFHFLFTFLGIIESFFILRAFVQIGERRIEDVLKQ